MKKVLALLCLLAVPLQAQVVQVKAATSAELTTETNARITADALKAPLASPTFTGKVTLAAGTTGTASIRIPHGTAPTSPAFGDLWTTTSGVFAHINGTTISYNQSLNTNSTPTFTTMNVATGSVGSASGGLLLTSAGGPITMSGGAVSLTASSTGSDLTLDTLKYSAAKVVSVTSSRNLANSDNGKTLVVTGSSAVTLTVPSGLTSGFRCEIINELTGAVACTIAASSTTLNGATASLDVPLGVRAVPCYVASNAYEVLFDGRRPPVFAYRTTLPVANYTSASGANQCWLTEMWAIPAQTNGLSPDNSRPAYIAKGNFVINSSTAGKQASLQILPASNLVGGSINGFISSGGGLRGDIVFNTNAGVVDVLSNTNQNRLKICGSGVASRKLRYKFNTNFAANAGDVIVMSPSGHTFVVDDTITDATVWTDATTGGVSVRYVTGGGTPTTSDTSLTVNGGSPITTTYVSNTATNSGSFPNSVLFTSSTGVHVMSATFGDFGFFTFSLN